MSDTEQSELARLTVELLSVFVANNTVTSDALPGLIEATRSALSGKSGETAPQEPEFKPAVSIEESLASRDHIISLIDGKPYKALKRHLANNGLTPEEYRARYSLPVNYPMVSPNYSERRRAFAKAAGLGGRTVANPAAGVAPVVAAPSAAKPVKVTAKKAPSGAKSRGKLASPASVKTGVGVMDKASQAPVAQPSASSGAAVIASDVPKPTPAPKKPAAKKASRPAKAVAKPVAKAASQPAVKAVPEPKSESGEKIPGKPARRMARMPASAESAAISAGVDAAQPAKAAAKPVAKQRAGKDLPSVAVPASTKSEAETAPKVGGAALAGGVKLAPVKKAKAAAPKAGSAKAKAQASKKVEVKSTPEQS
ncbi:MucR family transcriptional regulator [Novosphingobium sp. BL-8H]|uniref:MucR family transcriptional regulator n=1 Tax=Novosphingobium sp. BL-8H TaxID=3127640 RepID=UPI00375783F2